MAKDKKSKTADKKARVAAKTEKKTKQKEKKASSKKPSNNADADTDDDLDIDSVLAAYALEQERYLAVTETLCSPPSARTSSTLTASPSNEKELLLFGGEFFNGALARFYNDLYIYHTARDEWKLVTSSNTPLPRSGHAWTRAANKSEIYLFGGEFSSPKQGTFYHYNDFWRLEPSSREWEKLESPKAGKGGMPASPPARSGHRMCAVKQYIVLFGGFQDTSSSTKYLNDLWVYDTLQYRWHQPVLPPASQRPDARSSFSLLPWGEGSVMFGGYSRVKAAASTKGGTKRTGKGGVGAVYEVLKPVVHQDCWFLRITPPSAEAPQGTPPTVRWEKRKKPVNAPNPPRAGATMTYHRGRGIQFGGVHDVENSEEGIESEFFNNMSVWNIERNRCFDLGLRRPRVGKPKVQTREQGSRRERGKRGEEDLLANLKRLEMGDDVAANGHDEDVNGAQDDDEEEKVEKAISWEMPHPRFNAQLCVQDDVLYIFGGTFEKADREYTFDEMWSIDLGSLAGVKEIFRRNLEDWQAEESESEDEEDDEDDDDDEGSEDDEDEEADRPQPAAVEELRAPSTNGSISPEPSEADTTITEPEAEPVKDDRPHPRPFESLKDFFARTSGQWQDTLLEEFKYDRNPTAKSVKDIRKSAFERAEEKWWDCREDIQALEAEQEEAGIGEVVNLAEKAASATAGVGKRR